MTSNVFIRGFRLGALAKMKGEPTLWRAYQMIRGIFKDRYIIKQM